MASKCQAMGKLILTYDISILREPETHSELEQAPAMRELQRVHSVLIFSVERLQLLHCLFVLNSRSD